MEENGNKKPPVRRLTVKNFSVINEAELEFGKITVLIGPQSSGKSLLCKLAYFFQRVVREKLAESLRYVEPTVAAQARLQAEFSKWFPNTGTHPGVMIAMYSDGQYVVWVGGHNRDDGIGSYRLELCKEIIQRYEYVLETVRRQVIPSGGIVNEVYYAAIFGELDSLVSDRRSSIYTYIPSTRSLAVNRQTAVLSSSVGNDPIGFRFIQEFDFDFVSRLPEASEEHHLTEWIDRESARILQGEIRVNGNAELFHASDGRDLPLSILSSGTQELLSLLTSLRKFVAFSEAVSNSPGFQHRLSERLFFVEEPESSIFPSSQYEIVRVFVRMSNEYNLDASWVITTHSPYILSAFNNLLEADQVAATKPELKDEVAKLIPEPYWVKSSDFRAYCIHDGILESIMDSETGLISANYLDSVSETIGVEFDELLRLGYVES